MSQKIIIDVAPGGRTEIKVEGCPGPSCASLTAAIEKALGATVADQKTSEFRQTAKVGQQAKAGAQ